MGYSDTILSGKVISIEQLRHSSHEMPLVGTCDTCGESISIHIDDADPMLVFGCELDHAQFSCDAYKTECQGKFQCMGTPRKAK